MYNGASMVDSYSLLFGYQKSHLSHGLIVSATVTWSTDTSFIYILPNTGQEGNIAQLKP